MKYHAFRNLLCTIALSISSMYGEDVSLGIKGWELTENGKHKEAIELFKKCIENGNLSKSSLARTYRNIGIALRRDGSPKESVDYFHLSISLLQNDVHNDLINRGNSFSDLGDFKAALADYALAEAICPSEGETNYNRGIVYKRMNQIDNAKSEFIAAHSKGLRTKLLKDEIEKLNIIIK
jgi:tetratricopeptide (TPR) repeat protein